MHARLKQTNAQLFSPQSNRCATPDSVIESDSASAVIGQKEFPKGLVVPSATKGGSNSGSEFGSLASVNIVQEDDLDSGIGGRITLRQQQGSQQQSQRIDTEQRPFELKRISIEAIRRSNSNLYGVGVSQQDPNAKDSSWNLSEAPDEGKTMHAMQFANNGVPATPPNYYQYSQQQQYQQQQQPGPRQSMPAAGVASSGATSRSMSNLHQYRTSNVSPQRAGVAAGGGRRRWNVAPSPVTVGVGGGAPQTYAPSPANNRDDSYQHQYSTPQSANTANQFYGVGNTNSPYGLTPPQYFPQQQIQAMQQQQGPGLPQQQQSSGGLSASVSLSALRTAATSPSAFGSKFSQQQQQGSQIMTPKNGGGVYYPPSHFTRHSTGGTGADGSRNTADQQQLHQQQQQQQFGNRVGGAGETFDRKSSARNSYSKRYLKNIEEKTLWKPGSSEIRKRATSSIFNSNAFHHTPQHSNNFVEQKAESVSGKPGRMEGGAADSAGHLRMRSKSPTQLAHAAGAQRDSSNSGRRGSGQLSSVSSILQRRQTDNDSGSSVSRFSNVRQQSSMSNSPLQAKLLEAREMLKKSQENLAVLGALNGANAVTSSRGASAAAMARSRSIGNLKFGGVSASNFAAFDPNAADEPGGDYFKPNFSSSNEEGQSGGGLVGGRQMARSVNSLLQAAAGESPHQAAQNNLVGSKLGSLKAQYGGGASSRLAQSIRDLRKNSNPDLTNESLYEMDEEGEDQFSGDASAQYSATLPKNLRRGVQKKLERSGEASSRLRGGRASVGASGDLTQAISALSVGGAADENFTDPQHKLSVGSSSSGGRYIAYASPARSVSSVESRTSHRRTFDSLAGGGGGSSSATTRRTPNYLAQKFSGTDFVAPDVTPSHEDLSSAGCAKANHGSTASIDFLASVDVDALKTQNSKKMAMHTSECIQEMTKACDKLLGARHLICSDSTIAGAEKEVLVVNVNRAIATFRHRLDAVAASAASAENSRDGDA